MPKTKVTAMLVQPASGSLTTARLIRAAPHPATSAAKPASQKAVRPDKTNNEKARKTSLMKQRKALSDGKSAKQT